MNQLNYLHQILTLDVQDPVQLMCSQQILFEFERNWFNEVCGLRVKYGITETDEEIKDLYKRKWMCIVKNKVYTRALEDLNRENSMKSKTSHHPNRKNLRIQDYFMYLKPVRSGTLDLKTLRKYNYEEADVLCRLYGKEEETADHIMNKCMMVTRTEIIYDVYSLEREHIKIDVARVKMF